MDVDERIIHHGFTLIVRPHNGRIRGKAWPDAMAKEAGLTSIEVDADEQRDVIRGLKAAVNKALLSSLTQRHEAYLASKKVEPAAGKFFARPRLRTATCHCCGSENNNEETPECLACNGIICLRCAACLCGTPWRRG